MLVLVPALGSRLPRDREGDQGEGAAGAAFPAGVRASGLAVAERDEGGRGRSGRRGLFAGAHDEGGVGIDTRFCPDLQALASPFQVCCYSTSLGALRSIAACLYLFTSNHTSWFPSIQVLNSINFVALLFCPLIYDHVYFVPACEIF